MFNIINEFEKSKAVEFEPIQMRGKSIQDIVTEFVELIINRIRIPLTVEGTNLLKFLIDSRVIQKINVKKQLELNDYIINVADLSLLSGNFNMEITGTHEISIDIIIPNIVELKEFANRYGCKVKINKEVIGCI